MKSQIFGWTGKILVINLNDSSVTERDTMKYANRFLGGRGIATKIYWDEVTPEIDAFDPENRLILMTGTLTGTSAQAATRLTVISKSPMTLPERFCYGSMGGFFASFLKKAGYDGIVISGSASSPSYIRIDDQKPDDQKVSIINAESLWGKGTYEVIETLKNKHGKNTHIITTGIAGENRCRTATLVTSNEGSATGGFGAVMGSKNLKAIVVTGTGKPLVARKKETVELNRHLAHISKRGTLRMPVPRKMMEFVKTASCYQCGIECGRGLYKTANGRQEIRKCQAMVLYMPYAAINPEKIPNDSLIDVSLDATKICNDLSLCTMEIQNILLWLDACYRTGIFTDKDTGLTYTELGSLKYFNELVSMIANRKGFGDILAEGIIRAGTKCDKKAKALFHEHVTSVGMAGMYTPRQYPVTALLYGFEPRQPIAQLHDVSHLIARWLLHRIKPHLSPTTAKVFRKAAVKFWGHEKAWDMTTIEGKAVAAIKIQNHTYVKDSLGLCDFAWPIMDSFNTEDNIGDSTLEYRLFSAVTGIDIDEKGLDIYGERIFNLQRAILLREGWTPIDDDTPAEFNFTTPIEFDMLNPQLIVPGETEEPVSVKGNILNRDDFKIMRNEFYTLRGWNLETGLQKIELFERLDMIDIAKKCKPQIIN